MEFTIFIGSILLVLGFIGCFIPVIPGPPISFCSLLILHFSSLHTFNISTLILLGFIIILVTFLDYFLQIYGVKKHGGGRYATNGTIIGLILGIFIFSPFGIIIGPFIGAYIGARMDEKEYIKFIKNESINQNNKALKIAFGALTGLLAGTFLKIILNIYITFLFFYNIILY